MQHAPATVQPTTVTACSLNRLSSCRFYARGHTSDTTPLCLGDARLRI